MTFGIRIERLFFVSLLSVTVLSHSRKPAFSLQITLQESSDVFNVTFGKEHFNRLFTCLVSSKTCSVSYTEPYSNAHDNNVLFVSGSHPRTPEPEHQGIRHLTSFCTRTGIGKLKCENKHPADANQVFGVRPLWECDRHLCPCIYFYKARQISYDVTTAEECSRPSPYIARSKLGRKKRAPRFSRASRRRGSYSSGVGVDLSVDPSTGMIIGITIGSIVFVCFIGCLICRYVNRDKNKITANATTAESSNNMTDERKADNRNQDAKDGNESEIQGVRRNVETSITQVRTQ